MFLSKGFSRQWQVTVWPFQIRWFQVDTTKSESRSSVTLSAISVLGWKSQRLFILFIDSRLLMKPTDHYLKEHSGPLFERTLRTKCLYWSEIFNSSSRPSFYILAENKLVQVSIISRQWVFQRKKFKIRNSDIFHQFNIFMLLQFTSFKPPTSD